jgi:hypothetical protein
VTRPTPRIVPDEADQLPRLHQFRRDHADVMIGGGHGWWQARIPEPNGERIITRYTLRELLDQLDQLICTWPDDGHG